MARIPKPTGRTKPKVFKCFSRAEAMRERRLQGLKSPTAETSRCDGRRDCERKVQP